MICACTYCICGAAPCAPTPGEMMVRFPTTPRICLTLSGVLQVQPHLKLCILLQWMQVQGFRLHELDRAGMAHFRDHKYIP